MAEEDVVATETVPVLQVGQGGPDIVDVVRMGRVPVLPWRCRLPVLGELGVRAEPVVDGGEGGYLRLGRLRGRDDPVDGWGEALMCYERVAPCSAVYVAVGLVREGV